MRPRDDLQQLSQHIGDVVRYLHTPAKLKHGESSELWERDTAPLAVPAKRYVMRLTWLGYM